jgi:MFS family permease
MIGPMLVGLIVTGLIVLVGWRWQFHAMGILALVLPLPMIWFLVRDSAAQHPRVSAAEAALVTAGALSRNQDAPGRAARERGATWNNYRFWLVTAAIASNAIFFWGWSFWLPTYLRTARGFSFSVSGYLTFVIFGFAVATIVIVGSLRPHLPARGVRRRRLGAGRGLPDGSGLRARCVAERRPDDLRAVRAAGRHLLCGDADP